MQAQESDVFCEIGDVVTSEESHAQQVESLCMNCENNGMTTILPTKVPFFRELIIMSFYCRHCNTRNSEVQFGGTFAEQGVEYKLEVNSKEDFNREIIKSDWATIAIPALQFEIPSQTQKGLMSTIEGILFKALDDLRDSKDRLTDYDPTAAKQLDSFVSEMTMYVAGLKFPFTLVLRDPSGNSFVSNPNAPAADPNLKINFYKRTREENVELGLAQPRELLQKAVVMRQRVNNGFFKGVAVNGGWNLATYTITYEKPDEEELEEAPVGRTGAALKDQVKKPKFDVKSSTASKEGGNLDKLFFDSSASETAKEVNIFACNCHSCGRSGETRMCITDIPYFKEVILMAFCCDYCGFRECEVKSGGGIPPMGRTITLDVTPETAAVDLKRDVLKSDTAGLEIPELDMDLVCGSLGGMYTTVEGLLNLAKDRLNEANPFMGGDSAQSHRQQQFDSFFERMDKVISGEVPFTLIIKDPLANSFVYNPYAPRVDPRIKTVAYTRSNDEDIELGIADMKVEPEQYMSAEELAAHKAGEDSQ
eukprot:TRINITY_DN773074_c0_g1_i1.p1 TRINITY_DN773074_c0_g1~~TRINITY_DN773074_c0_g1_i1.p1  ORF type:complete len:535 (+),score=210.96 TRINITY_DN773074_c0_g1_i1:91-1695(+)